MTQDKIIAACRNYWKNNGGVVAFVLIWTSLLMYQQELCCFMEFSNPERWLMRLGLNLLFLFGFVLLVPRWIAFGTMVASIVVQTGLTMYARYFDHAITPLTIFNNVNEGISVWDVIIKLLPEAELSVYFSAAILSFVILLRSPALPLTYSTRLFRGLTLWVIYVAVIAGVSAGHGSRNICGARCIETRHRLIASYGSFPPMLVELFLVDSKVLLDRALAEKADTEVDLEKFVYLRSAPRIVAIQVEALGNGILNAQCDGQELTPYIKQLSKRCVYLVANPFHYNGSADADFAFLATKAPSHDIANYRIQGFPYINTLVDCLHENDYFVTTIHGNSRDFYNRFAAYKKMRVDRMIFAEEMEDVLNMTMDRKNHVLDERAFDLCLDELRKDTHEKTFYHIITMSSHAPYNYLEELEEMDLANRYAKSMQYVDRQIQKFIESLPPDVLVVLYGDHTVGFPGIEKTRSRISGFNPDDKMVPCLMFLAGDQENADHCVMERTLASSGNVTLVDVSRYVKGLVAAPMLPAEEWNMRLAQNKRDNKIRPVEPIRRAAAETVIR